ncbi:MAG: TfoX/Sxy family protein [Chloroflexota bacterium]|nr:TfoX/Sxy family protein [Chloroflexota bacterium]
MAYSEALAERIRQLIGEDPAVREQRMFGGLAFLINGNMAVAASGQGGLMVRVSPEQSDELVATSPARLMEMGSRPMRGWLRIDEADVGSDGALRTWVERGTSYARGLPPKP